MTVTITVAVIPCHPREGGGQAGIQTIDKAHTQWDNTPNMALATMRRFDDKLDSGLMKLLTTRLSRQKTPAKSLVIRRNDELVDFVYCFTRFKRCLQLCKAQ